MKKKSAYLTKRAEKIISMFMDRKMFPRQSILVEEALETLLEKTLEEQSKQCNEPLDENIVRLQLETMDRT